MDLTSGTFYLTLIDFEHVTMRFLYFRSSHQSRNVYAENGSGDSQRSQQEASATFFRNNERYNGSSGNASGTAGGRFDQRPAGNFNNKPRTENYRSGSRFAQGSNTNATQRKP